ncbi:sodium:proton symporter [Roseibium suaedae]|uniref:Bile acid:Na+ symporter, BASS family n=1 Tax=Roseibium suaedae TaxID=735517 RepID=A0A1M7G883_9HYPH|nr:sodium:proton symporter [Roseibium suaedae]SHM12582.1 bile acid:Na+ symporter, BASS family [Roseibium suaedae]
MYRHGLSALAWLGRRGTLALPISILLGIGLPFLSAYARPFLTETVFLLLVLAFLRVDPNAVRLRLSRPRLTLLASFWMALGVPLLCAGLIALARPDWMTSDLAMILFIVTAAPCVMSAPAFIYLMGLDGALSLTVLITATAIAPLSAPLMAEIQAAALPAGTGLHLDGLPLALRLAALLGGSILTAALIRKIAGKTAITEAKSSIDGLNVLILLFFAIAAMDGVAASFAERPLFTSALALATFAAAFVQILITLLLFAPAGIADAFAIAHATGNRNMGLMVAALGGTLPELVWLWFALGQLPIYMLPFLLKPVARHISARPVAGITD